MAVRFDKAKVSKWLRSILAAPAIVGADQDWIEKIKVLVELCEQGNARTHIAFVGTQLLARSQSSAVDLYYIKPEHAPEDKKEFSYSARTLCHGVLVPLSTEFDIDLGAKGAEPLNNQPYFRMSYLGDQTPVSAASHNAWQYMLSLMAELEEMDSDAAEAALRSFLLIRKNAGRTYAEFDLASNEALRPLGRALTTLIRDDSENGKRAQAAVAAIFDCVFGIDRVDTGSGRINDPSRNRPGDVCVRANPDTCAFEKAFEVKDKAVDEQDVIRFIRNSNEAFDVFAFGYVAVAESQASLDMHKIEEWADRNGANVQVFFSLEDLLRQAVFWASGPATETARNLPYLLRDRLIEIEASESAVDLWISLTSSTE